MSNAPQDCKVNNAAHVKINAPRTIWGWRRGCGLIRSITQQSARVATRKSLTVADYWA